MNRRFFLRTLGIIGLVGFKVSSFSKKVFATLARTQTVKEAIKSNDSDVVAEYILKYSDRAVKASIEEKIKMFKILLMKFDSKDKEGRVNLESAALILFKNIEVRSESCKHIAEVFGGKSFIIQQLKKTTNPKLQEIFKQSVATHYK